jgi:hypothetical protein
MAHQTVTLPPPTCSKAPPAPAITLVANAEGEAPTIAPNTWIEIQAHAWNVLTNAQIAVIDEFGRRSKFLLFLSDLSTSSRFERHVSILTNE